MKNDSPVRRPLLVLGLIGAAGCPCAALASPDDVSAVSSEVSRDYVRQKEPDGTFQPEYYSFGQGGHLSATSDPTIDRMAFLDVARTLAGALAARNYLPARDPKNTRLLVMLYWGLTNTAATTNDSLAAKEAQDAAAASAAANRDTARMANAPSGGIFPGGPMPCARFDPNYTVDQVDGQVVADNAYASALAVANAESHTRDSLDTRTAALLGYGQAWNTSLAYIGTPLEYRREDLVREIEDGRYFVILMAYDFQRMWKQKEHKLLWETRVSIRQRHHQFDQDLASMAAYAEGYFGRDSNGLIRREIPEGRVDIGELKVVDSATPK